MEWSHRNGVIGVGIGVTLHHLIHYIVPTYIPGGVVKFADALTGPTPTFVPAFTLHSYSTPKANVFSFRSYENVVPVRFLLSGMVTPPMS